MRSRPLSCLVLLGLVSYLGACGGGLSHAPPPRATSTPAADAAESYAPRSEAAGRSGGDYYAPPAGASVAPSPPPQQERPGLGTRFGEDRYSPVRDVAFERQGGEPLYVASLHYNDHRGIEAMRRAQRVSAWRSGEPLFRSRVRAGALFGGVTIRVVDQRGRTLPAYHVADRVLVVGEAGQRYALLIENHTGRRFEVVASVDGLDVVDGQTASLGKRGYVVAPYGRIEIEGYRRSLTEVAAFRFSSVRDSYAAQTAESGDRHVGVIGVALFAEVGADLDGLDEEAERREQADPFPGRFAQPPPNN